MIEILSFSGLPCITFNISCFLQKYRIKDFEEVEDLKEITRLFLTFIKLGLKTSNCSVINFESALQIYFETLFFPCPLQIETLIIPLWLNFNFYIMYDKKRTERDVESFRKSFDIEMFLKTTLDLHDCRKAEMDLKDGYKIMIERESGEQRFITAKQYDSHVKKMLRYFRKAIDKVARRNPVAKQLHEELQFASSANGMWNLYQDLDKMNKSSKFE